MLNAIQMGVVTSSTKQRLEELEQRKSEIETSILNEEIEHPTLTKENIVFWISKFKYLDMDVEKNRQYLIDTFINSVYLYDDKTVITYNIKDGTRTITLEELKNSDLVQHGSPSRRLRARSRVRPWGIPQGRRFHKASAPVSCMIAERYCPRLREE